MNDQSQKKRRLVLVDRDSSILLTFRIALASHGYEVKTCQELETALRLIQERSVDAIVIDPLLTASQSNDFLQQLREISPKLPVLIVSIDPPLADGSDRLTQDPFVHFLAKPTLPVDIRKAVDGLFNIASDFNPYS